MYCGEQTAVKDDGNEMLAVTLKCKSWLCPHCTDQRRRRLIAQGIQGAPTRFLTLTIKPLSGETPDQAAVRLSHAWRCCRLRLMRYYGLKKLAFLAVFEAHESGQPHLHILLRCRYLKQKLISRIMMELIGSPVTWIEIIKSKAKAVAYCAKYCGKCTKKFANSKRYWQSQDYCPKTEQQYFVFDNIDAPWSYRSSPIRWIYQCFQRYGYNVWFEDSTHLCGYKIKKE